MIQIAIPKEFLLWPRLTPVRNAVIIRSKLFKLS